MGRRPPGSRTRRGRARATSGSRTVFSSSTRSTSGGKATTVDMAQATVNISTLRSAGIGLGDEVLLGRGGAAPSGRGAARSRGPRSRNPSARRASFPRSGRAGRVRRPRGAPRAARWSRAPERAVAVERVAGIDLAPEELHLAPVRVWPWRVAEAPREVGEFAREALEAEDLEEREPGLQLRRACPRWRTAAARRRAAARRPRRRGARPSPPKPDRRATMVRLRISGKRSSM